MILREQIVAQNLAEEKRFLGELSKYGFDYYSVEEVVEGLPTDDTIIVKLIKDYIGSSGVDGVKAHIVSLLNNSNINIFTNGLEVLELIGIQEENHHETRAFLANALKGEYIEEYRDILVELISKETNPTARLNLYYIFCKKKDPFVEKYLIERMGADPEMAQVIIQILGDMRSEKALPQIEPYLSHKDSWMRDEAKRAVAKIEKHINKR